MTLSPSCSAIASGLRVVTVTVSLLVVLLYAIFVYNRFKLPAAALSYFGGVLLSLGT